MKFLDDSIVATLKEKLFHRERIAELLSSLAERRAARATAVENRLYQSISDGIAELDDLIGEA